MRAAQEWESRRQLLVQTDGLDDADLSGTSEHLGGRGVVEIR